MSIVGLVATWRGEHLLEECVASMVPFCDEVIVLDGGYAAIDRADVTTEPMYSRTKEALAVGRAGGIFVPAPARTTNPGRFAWAGEIEKRNVLLELGRAVVPEDGDRWALVLDEDELLVHGDRLYPWLAEERLINPGLPRVEPDGQVWLAPSRLFRLTPSVHYYERSYWLDYSYDGRGHVSLEHRKLDGPEADLSGPEVVPFVRHRWNERSPGRQEVQHRYGRMLAALDHGG